MAGSTSSFKFGPWCPIDLSRLELLLTSKVDAFSPDLSVRYCPQCDVAFVWENWWLRGVRIGCTAPQDDPRLKQWSLAGQLDSGLFDRYRSTIESLVEKFKLRVAREAGAGPTKVFCPEDGSSEGVDTIPMEKDGERLHHASCAQCGYHWFYRFNPKYGWYHTQPLHPGGATLASCSCARDRTWLLGEGLRKPF
jgi:hypothetical protein